MSVNSNDEKLTAALIASRGVLLCARCGTVARVAAGATAVDVPACPTCGQAMEPYDPTANPVGTDPRNALWGFGAF